MDRFYSGYVAFKGWDGAVPADRAEEFQAIFDACAIDGRARILEIGFGGGELLDWARAAGHAIEGLEIIPELADAARARGHEVRLGSPETLPDGRYDIIIALDVLEHLDRDQLSDMLAHGARMLKPGGAFVARFPNGDSPFSGPNQHGDITHRQVLTAGALDQVARPAGLGLARAFNLRPRPKGVLRALKRSLAYWVRDVIETLYGTIYFGHAFPIDPNIMVILKARQP